jgi:hypothetical protein
MEFSIDYITNKLNEYESKQLMLIEKRKTLTNELFNTKVENIVTDLFEEYKNNNMNIAILKTVLNIYLSDNNESSIVYCEAENLDTLDLVSLCDLISHKDKYEDDSNHLIHETDVRNMLKGIDYNNDKPNLMHLLKIVRALFVFKLKQKRNNERVHTYLHNLKKESDTIYACSLKRKNDNVQYIYVNV